VVPEKRTGCWINEQQALASKSLEFAAEEYLPENVAVGNLLP
jgi:DNA topoisomerase VI subunit A